ncbi:MAG: glutathione S-transferase N-terminal domain-containing protein [Pseudomonadales bacterium]|jgi:glutathione S-transferase
MSASLVLYHSEICPYCHRVRRFMAGAGIELPLKDVNRDPEARRELLAGGGSAMVPCLRIEQEGSVRWLYESLDIIDYLRQASNISTTRGVTT